MKRIMIYCTTLAILVMIFLVSGCGPMYQTTYTLVPPKTYRGRMCVNQCLSDKNQCTMSCRRIDQRCHAEADRAARPAYNVHVREQHRRNQRVQSGVSDFADYSNCRPGCNCTVNYRQCYANCGGTVTPHTICTAFCKKAVASAPPKGSGS